VDAERTDLRMKDAVVSVSNGSVRQDQCEARSCDQEEACSPLISGGNFTGDGCALS
jgi:hypothetical protein